MTWSDVFPIFPDELYDEYLADAPKQFRREADQWFAEKQTFNRRDVRHIVSVSLFWKNINSDQPDIVIRDRADFMSAGKTRKLLRFEPWSYYVKPVLEAAYRLHAARNDVAFRVYLAADLEFLVEDLVAAGCEVRLMCSSSIRHNPGAMWRLLALADCDRLITIVDADHARQVEYDVSRTEAMAQCDLKWWRVPQWGELNDKGTVAYRPFLGLQFGSQGGLTEVGTMMKALIWAGRNGKMETFAKLPGCVPKAVHGTHFPDYGFDEWFLLSAIYPRAAYDGLLTFVPSDARSRLLALDVQYATRAHGQSEIHYFGPSEAGCCVSFSNHASLPGTVVMREDCRVVPENILKGNISGFATGTTWVAMIGGGLEASPQGAEVFLDRRMDSCDVAHSGYAFTLVTPEIAKWAKRRSLSPEKWKAGQPVRYPRISGSLVMWRDAFLRKLLTAWFKAGKPVRLELFLLAWEDEGLAVLVEGGFAGQGWVKATTNKVTTPGQLPVAV